MAETQLDRKTVLITGAAKRIGRALALTCAQAGANVVIHFNRSSEESLELKQEIESLGCKAWAFQADLEKPEEVYRLMEEASAAFPLYALVNNASVFEPLSVVETTVEDWDRHMAINLTAPLLLSQVFAAQVPAGQEGRIVNLLDWRALRPGPDHFPYNISKSGLAALTRILARAFAPNITVNGLALGAILPPTDGAAAERIIEPVPAGRWGSPRDVGQALLFLLTKASYTTGGILHVDGGRHLV